MRTAFAAALLVAAACTSDPAVDPAWVTAGAAPTCTEDNAVLADPVGSWRATWACIEAGDLATGIGGKPCDPDVNPFLGHDVDVSAGAAQGQFVLAIDGEQIAASRSTPTSHVIASADEPAGASIRFTAIVGCTEAANPVVLVSHWRPAATDVPQILNAWRATLTRQ